MSGQSADTTAQKSTTQPENDNLCYDCARLIKNLKYKRYYKQIEYGSLLHFDWRIEGQKQKCPLCAVIKETIEEFRAAESDTITKAELEFNALLKHACTPTSVWQVILDVQMGQLFSLMSLGATYHRQIPLGVIDEGSKVTSSARLIDKDKINFSLIKQWVAHCQKHHEPMNKSTPSQASAQLTRPLLYFIDVMDGCLVNSAESAYVPASSNQGYIALSYVWGKIKAPKMSKTFINDCCKPGGLLRMPLPLPAAIADAMIVVRELGFRFLWVDSLCIIQDDEQHLKASISTMHLIYGEAELVVVAAEGQDARAGIPSLQSRQGLVQGTVKAADNLTLARVWNPWISLASSCWDQRAWTLQERVLAKRCLVFVDGKVFMTCRTQRLCASEDQEGTGLKLADVQVAALPADINYDFDKADRDSVATAYTNLASAYSKMKLTYNSDVINAFTGLDNVFQQYEAKVYQAQPEHYQSWLMPQAFMDEMMLWQTVQTSSRRAGLGDLSPPSWSWMAWESEVKWPCADEEQGKKAASKPKSMIHSCVAWQRTMPQEPTGPLQSLLTTMKPIISAAAPFTRSAQYSGQYLVIQSFTATLKMGNAGVLDGERQENATRWFDLIIATTDQAGTKDARCQIPLGCCPFYCEELQDHSLVEKEYYDGKCINCRFGFNHLPRHPHEGMHTHTAYRGCGFVSFNDRSFSKQSPGDSCEYVIMSESRDERLDRRGTGRPNKEKALMNPAAVDQSEEQTDERFHLYNVLAIAPNSDPYRSYRRVGLGRIQKKAWELMQPKFQTVVLA